jgi:hypothetical protein
MNYVISFLLIIFQHPFRHAMLSLRSTRRFRPRGRSLLPSPSSGPTPHYSLLLTGHYTHLLAFPYTLLQHENHAWQRDEEVVRLASRRTTVLWVIIGPCARGEGVANPSSSGRGRAPRQGRPGWIPAAAMSATTIAPRPNPGSCYRCGMWSRH